MTREYHHLLLYLQLLLLLLLPGHAEAATKPTDKAVMMELMNSIVDSATTLGWDPDQDPCTWKHVQCTEGSVTGLFMQSLSLQGTLPSSLNSLSSLKSLSLQFNRLGGQLPSLKGLSKLQTAFLNDNNFDIIPSDFFRNLTSLEGIYLNNNPLNSSTGWELSEDLLGSPQLTNLSLYNVSLRGSLPDFLGSFQSLRVLSVPYNGLTGPLPRTLNGSTLQILVANSQGLDGHIDVLAEMPALTQVWLHSNNFSGTIPMGLGAGLQELLLAENQLTGPIPNDITELKLLRNFTIDNNLIDGPIPKFQNSVFFTYKNNFFCGSECSNEVKALLSSLGGIGYPPDIVRSWSGNDPCADWVGVNCNVQGKVSVLNLANRKLSGKIDSALGNLSSLAVVKLNSNHLTGRIPDSLVGLKSLKQLDVSNNNLTGPIPKFGSQVVFNTNGNPFINTTLSPQGGNASSGSGGGNSTTGSATATGAGKNSHKSIWSIVIGTVIGVIVFLLIGLGVFVIVFKLRRKRKELEKHAQKPPHGGIELGSAGGSSNIVGTSQGNIVYPLWVLLKATDNFNHENLLGKGGFGSVYEGRLDDGTKIAVKRMDPELVSNKGLQEFQAEINMLGKVRHRNLVALLGYCTENNERLLVYEYMPQGTLSEHLFHWQDKALKPLDWSTRLLVALDVAHGMQYLHNLAFKIIIHRDLKPSNILLDDGYRAKVSDFGLAKLAPEDKVSVETRLAGTFGYLAPEYAVTGRITTKSDVYSFGVVLMELITGQKALDERRPEEKVHLVPWFRHICRDEEQLIKVIDPAIQVTEENRKSISMVAELSWHCTHREPTARPDMGYAVAVLGPLVTQWKPSSSQTQDNEDSQVGMTPEQAFKQWKIFDESSFSIPPTRPDEGCSDNTSITGPGSISAR